MRWLAGLLLALVFALPAAAQNADGPFELDVPDGQFISHVITVYFSEPLTKEQNPKLVLYQPRTPFTDAITEFRDAKLLDIGINQAVSARTDDGRVILKSETMLLFSLEDFEAPFYKPLFRTRPALHWDAKDTAARRSVIMQSNVYFADAVTVNSYAVILVTVLVAMFAVLSRRATGSFFGLLCGRNGRLSLSRTQVACWTAAIGGTVFAFGLKELKVPEVPLSLVALMGLSLGTNGVSSWQYLKSSGQKPAEGGQGASDPDAGAAASHAPSPEPVKPPNPRWIDLISMPDPQSGQLTTSISRAQMAFWTVLVVIIYVGKSFVDGVLWQVPWELVALMGISQAGYLGPQFTKT